MNNKCRAIPKTLISLFSFPFPSLKILANQLRSCKSLSLSFIPEEYFPSLVI